MKKLALATAVIVIGLSVPAVTPVAAAEGCRAGHGNNRLVAVS